MNTLKDIRIVGINNITQAREALKVAVKIGYKNKSLIEADYSNNKTILVLFKDGSLSFRKNTPHPFQNTIYSSFFLDTFLEIYDTDKEEEAIKEIVLKNGEKWKAKLIEKIIEPMSAEEFCHKNGFKHLVSSIISIMEDYAKYRLEFESNKSK